MKGLPPSIVVEGKEYVPFEYWEVKNRWIKELELLLNRFAYGVQATEDDLCDCCGFDERLLEALEDFKSMGLWFTKDEVFPPEPEKPKKEIKGTLSGTFGEAFFRPYQVRLKEFIESDPMAEANKTFDRILETLKKGCDICGGKTFYGVPEFESVSEGGVFKCKVKGFEMKPCPKCQPKGGSYD